MYVPGHPAAQRAPRLRLVSEPPPGSAEPVTDARIVEAFGRGDVGLGELMFDRLHPVVEGTLFRMLGVRGPDHDDLMQESFEQIVLTLMRRRFAQACSLRAWAAAITAKVALGALRSRRSERKVFDPAPEDPETAGDHPDPEHQAQRSQELDQLRRVLGRMSPRLAQTLVLHDALGHDLAEVAALTGVTVAAAQSRLVRGRRDLQRRLGTATGRVGQ
jgi:RNA polymerase sigma-70 factor (ECF subfamily)